MIPLQTPEGVRLEVSNSRDHDYVRGHWSITASAKCCCGKTFSNYASIPEAIIENDMELTGSLSQALVKLIVDSRQQHLLECP